MAKSLGVGKWGPMWLCVSDSDRVAGEGGRVHHPARDNCKLSVRHRRAILYCTIRVSTDFGVARVAWRGHDLHIVIEQHLLDCELAWLMCHIPTILIRMPVK